MNVLPHTLLDAEKDEISRMPDIMDMWGAENEHEMRTILDTRVYAAKFDYQSGSPGYVGDLFVLVGDVPERPLTLGRDSHGDIRVLS